MLPWLGENFGNASSIHSYGRDARHAVDASREQIATSLGLDAPEQVLFTSGATEGNNWILRNFGEGAISPFEHSSVLEPGLELNFAILPNRNYVVDTQGQHRLVSVVLVSNETGAVISAPNLQGALVHRDITQAVGHIPLDLEDVDFATFGGHKLGGQLGVGVLIAKDPTHLQPWVLGGGHEFGLRAGTLNVAGIVGLAKAVQLAVDELDQRLHHFSTLRHAALDAMQGVSGWVTDPAHTRSPHILHLAFDDVQGEAIVVELDNLGFAISSGAACGAESGKPSRTLEALGYSAQHQKGAIRISFHPENTLDSTSKLMDALVKVVQNLRN